MPTTQLDANDHVWRVLIDSQGHNEKFSDVICELCGVPGQLNNETKEVFYPAT